MRYFKSVSYPNHPDIFTTDDDLIEGHWSIHKTIRTLSPEEKDILASDAYYIELTKEEVFLDLI